MSNYKYDPKTRRYSFDFFEIIVQLTNKSTKIGPFRHKHNAIAFAKDEYEHRNKYAVISGFTMSDYPPAFLDD